MPRSNQDPDEHRESELEDLDVEPETAGEVGGGAIPDVARTPTPGGPVPIPYPNVPPAKR